MLERITRLERNLEQLGRTRRTQRRARQRGRHRAVSLVGYTNTGKSTLLNRLTDAGVLAENRLFATLDPRTRRLSLPGGEVVLLSDTVGFVKKLPTQLVQAFRSTLEVVGEADLLVHVVDAAAADPEAQMEAVRTVLTEIGAGEVPELVCVNKADLDPEAGGAVAKRHPGAVVVSAVTGDGIDELLRAVGDRLRALASVCELFVPWDRGDVIAAVHREGEVLSEGHEEKGARIRARLDPVARSRFGEFATSLRL
jgi:GTP-binding protein HflX